ncbi:MAG TPA: CPBP family intramembrane glutamic endopeptidase [Acidobacteriaceae bacterium]|nr:CPBP family intramembrane glutamic endopeptidase [Acidobacteriaceae bacterium]
MWLSSFLLALCLGSLGWSLRRDVADYRTFKLLTKTSERQKRYRKWVLKSFLLFSCTPVAALAILGRLGGLVELPREFRPLFGALNAHAPAASTLSPSLVGSFLGALAAGLIAGVLMPRLLRRRAKPIQVGDIAALLPRNGAETAWTALLSVNAGVGEELYFRLLLPLLLVSVCGNALAAFVIAGLIFGAVHFYQGVAGILATTIIGGALAALYLWTGNLWVAAAAHALLDLVGLVIRPTIQRLVARSTAVRA